MAVDLVTVETDAGLTGVGDATNRPGGRAVEGAIAELDGLLRGEDPRRIGPPWTKMQHHLTYVGSAGAAVGAIQRRRHRAVGHRRQVERF